LLSRVIREGLSTGAGATRPGSGLSGSIFSGPVACADLVKFSKTLKMQIFFHARLNTSISGASTGWNTNRTCDCPKPIDAAATQL